MFLQSNLLYTLAVPRTRAHLLVHVQAHRAHQVRLVRVHHHHQVVIIDGIKEQRQIEAEVHLLVVVMKNNTNNNNNNKKREQT